MVYCLLHAAAPRPSPLDGFCVVPLPPSAPGVQVALPPVLPATCRTATTPPPPLYLPCHHAYARHRRCAAPHTAHACLHTAAPARCLPAPAHRLYLSHLRAYIRTHTHTRTHCYRTLHTLRTAPHTLPHYTTPPHHTHARCFTAHTALDARSAYTLRSSRVTRNVTRRRRERSRASAADSRLRAPTSAFLFNSLPALSSRASYLLTATDIYSACLRRYDCRAAAVRIQAA